MLLSVECELSVRRVSNRSPPLPELTVMCGGRRGVREPSEAIAKVKGGGTSYIQRNSLINLLRLMSSIGIVETMGTEEEASVGGMRW